MTEVVTGLPPGWEYSKGERCIVSKHLEDFKYAEIRYEPDNKFGWDYALYLVNRDGPTHEERQSRHSDLTKALRAGNTL